MRAEAHPLQSSHVSEGVASCGTDVEARTETHMLRALFVLNSLNVGGSETKVVRLVNALHRRNVPAGIAYLNAPRQLLPSIDPSVPVWHLGRRGKFSLAALSRLSRLIDTVHPSVVLSVNLYPALYVALATARPRRQPRTIGLLNTTAPLEQDRWRRTFYRPVLRRLDRIVFGCDLQRGEWAPYVHADAARASVIYNGVDTNRFAPVNDPVSVHLRCQHDIPASAFVFGTVGRLAPEKNQIVMIETLAALRGSNVNAHMIIVGEGPERARLARRAAELALEPQVTFAGVQGDVRPWLSMMDVFVLPSRHVETFSNAALEAMAMQRPVILSRIGGADEMVRDGLDGYVIDIGALDEALPRFLRVLAEDPSRRARLGRSARERVEREFSMESMVERFSRLIDTSADVRGTS